MKFKILHERWKCIGCSACAAVDPEHWEMNADGRSDLKKAKTAETPAGEEQELILEEKEIGNNKEAEASCPVECIHVKEKKLS